MTQIGKLGSVSFGSWWCGAGNDPRTSPLSGEEPTIRKGSYSEELVRIVRTHWPCNSDSVNHRRRDHDRKRLNRMNILTAMLRMPM